MISESKTSVLKRTWQEFVNGGFIDVLNVRPTVAASWQRCVQAGISPYAPKTAVKLNSEELAALREKNKIFIEVALPFMKFLETAVMGSGYILVLSDANCIVLETFGNEEIIRFAAENNYVPGCTRSEAEFGTNTIGLSMITGQPEQLSGPEHFNARHHDWTCSSAPVRSPNGKLIGTITLTGKFVSPQLHTLGMVIAAAEGISTSLSQVEMAEQKARANILLSSVLESVSEAMLTIDGDGVINHLNAGAARLLGGQENDFLGQHIQKLFPATPGLVDTIVTAKNSVPIELTVDSRTGRSHYIAKPYLMQKGKDGAILILTERKEFLKNVREISNLTAVYTFSDLIGTSDVLQDQISLAKVASRQDCRVLITGETGTGKELFAQAIHNHSVRSKGPFVALNCAAIPRELLESEIFGYSGGAFTGARKNGQVGKLELADGGTVFLDEISQMSLDLQSKLLRVLQDGLVTRLGDSKPIKVDVRIIAATNEDLLEKSRNGAFRKDLYFRLSVIELFIPPLRERSGDIPLLVEYILSRIAAKMGGPKIVVSQSAMEILVRHYWEGNVRELENILEMASILCEDWIIEPKHLSQRIKSRESAHSLRSPNGVAAGDKERGERSHAKTDDIDLEELRTTMKELNGNITLVSRKLGISRSTIYRRMKEHHLNRLVEFE